MDLVLRSVIRVVIRVPRERVHIEDVDEPVRIARARPPRGPPGGALIEVAAAEDKQLVLLQLAAVVVAVHPAVALIELEVLERRQRKHVCVGEGYVLVHAEAAVDDDAVRRIVGGGSDSRAEGGAIAWDLAACALRVPALLRDVVDADAVELALGRSAVPMVEGGEWGYAPWSIAQICRIRCQRGLSIRRGTAGFPSAPPARI